MKKTGLILLGKEIKLALHPTAFMFMALGAMLLIPNYPYYVTFFYMGLAVFFTCLNGRENQDVSYSLLLPVSKKNIVDARIGIVIILELTQMLVSIPFAILRQHMPLPPNAVGMEANIALYALALVMVTLFNAVFFGTYYKNVQKVGKAFILGSIADFVYMTVAETVTHIVPFFRDKLDTMDNMFIKEKLIVLTAGIVIFAIGNYLVLLRARRDFEKQDI